MPSSDQQRTTRGLLAEPAVTRELNSAEQKSLEQARIARGEQPRPTITAEHRARLEADRAAAIADAERADAERADAERADAERS